MACAELGTDGSQRQMFEDPAAWCADRAPGQQFPADALPLDVRQLQNSALPIQVDMLSPLKLTLQCLQEAGYPSM